MKNKSLRFAWIMGISICGGLVSGCCSQTGHTESSVACKKVFQGNRLDLDAAKSLSIRDLVAVEKCGFQYHPPVSFYSEIMDNQEYPIPELLAELRGTRDDYWRAHIVYLTKEVIERQRFKAEVKQDRNLIAKEVDEAFHKTREESRAYERIHSLRDGINMFFLKYDKQDF